MADKGLLTLEERMKINEQDMAFMKDSMKQLLAKFNVNDKPLQLEVTKPASVSGVSVPASSSKAQAVHHVYAQPINKAIGSAGPKVTKVIILPAKTTDKATANKIQPQANKRALEDDFDRPLPASPKKKKPEPRKLPVTGQEQLEPRKQPVIGQEQRGSLIDQDTVSRVVHEVSSDSDDNEDLSPMASALVKGEIDSVQQAVEEDVASVQQAVEEEDVVSVPGPDEMAALYASLKTKTEPEGFRPGMCDIIADYFRGEISKETFNSYVNEFPIPDNCPNLHVPRVNEPVWENLPKPARLSDLSIQAQQRELSVGSACVAHCIQRLQDINQSLPLEQAKEVSDVAYDLGKSLILFGSSFNQASIKRRRDMKQCLNPVMFPLLRDDFPVGTEYLFGDNLSYAMREVQDSRRVASQVAKKPFQARGKPYNKRGRQSFPQHQNQSQNYQNLSKNRQFQNRSFPRGRGQSVTRGRGRGSRRGSRY